MHPPTTKQNFPALTGIRAAGAMAVFFVHLPFDTGRKIVIDVMPFFFVLSGFLIVYLYYNDEAVKQANFKKYIVNRFARIYPVYFLLITVAIICNHNFNLWYIIKNYTLINGLFANNTARAIQPSWSITTEECFYLAAPFLMYLIRRFNAFTAFLFGVLLLSIALVISTFSFSFYHGYRFIFAISFPGHFFEFFCGMMLALTVLKKKNNIVYTATNYTALGITGIILSIGILVITNNMNDAERPVSFFLVNNLLLPIPIAVFYYGLITEKSLAATVLSIPLMQWLGKASYAFYLLHSIIIDFVGKPFIEILFKNHYNFYVLTIFAATELIAVAIYYWYEHPLNSWIRKRFR
ncbi:MAG: hypothetical protein C0459_04025 [Chitinophaga sp.]|nr:hypothetical protein [Chitinophaga sp.]